MDKYIQYFLIGINFITILFFASDKFKAKHGKWRIPESTLLLLAFFGGSPGAVIGMKLFNHKTRKPLFRFGVPALLIIHAAVIIYLKYKHIF